MQAKFSAVMLAALCFSIVGGCRAATNAAAAENSAANPAAQCNDATNPCKQLSGGCKIVDCVNGVCVDRSGSFKAVGDACDDGNLCTTDDYCDGNGACFTGVPKFCDDSNSCTDDKCDKAKGCTNIAKQAGAACNAEGDGDPDTVNDKCGIDQVAKQMVCHGTPSSDCMTDGDCAKFTAEKACFFYACLDVAGSATKKCSLAPVAGFVLSNPCAGNTCNAKTGQWEHPAITGTLSCDDNNACTVGDTCKDGTCASGTALSCDDNNACTTDACDSKKGCVNAANALVCDDGNACTVGDACKSSACVSGSAKNCDDGKPCTLNVCDVKKGCDNGPEPAGAQCDDGDPKTIGDTCSATGVCKAGKLSTFCNLDTDCGAQEGNACATYVCDTGLHLCKPQVIALVDDGNPCTIEYCDPKAGQQMTIKPGLVCDDNNPCTTGEACDAAAKCVGKPTVCDDNNACTDDACLPGKGCSSAAKVCNDSDPFTADVCVGPDKGNFGCIKTPYVVTLTCEVTPGIACDVAYKFVKGEDIVLEGTKKDVVTFEAKILCAMLALGQTLYVNSGTVDELGGVDWIGGQSVVVSDSLNKKTFKGQLGGITFWNALDEFYKIGDVPICALMK